MDSDDSSLGRTHSVSVLIDRLKAGDRAAAEQIWNRYFQRLIPLAKAKLGTLRDRSVDEQDALISVFDRFFCAAQQGNFPQLHDRNDLWQILLMLTEHKVADLYRRAGAQKRAEPRLAGTGVRAEAEADALLDLVDGNPTPEFAAIFVETTDLALGRLHDQKTREVAVLRMEGYANREIAQRLGISLTSVERKVRVIRELWKDALQS
jgi:DNA-directed RNA polymerase specialized sigma24 family protein